MAMKKIGLLALYDLNSFSVRTLHSVLKKKGFDVESLFFKCENPNNTMTKPSEEEMNSLIMFIESKKYEIIGVSVRSSLFSVAGEIAMRLKKLGNPPLVVFGGIQSTLNPEKCLKYADVATIGEGEWAFSDVCKGTPLKKIKNIFYKSKGNIIKNKFGFLEEDLDKIPFPDFLDKSKYFFNEGKIRPMKTREYKTRYSLMTSRGCPFSCTYCCNSTLRKMCHGKYLRRRSVNNVIAELKIAKRNFPNILYVSFLDDVFTFDEKWVREFSIKYKREINLPFYCYTHSKMCREVVIRDLENAGLKNTTMGVQSFSEEIRKGCYERDEKNVDILKSAKILKKFGIHFALDIIMDNPLETEEDLKINLNWLLKIPAPFELHTHTLTYFPNTKISEDFLKQGLIKETDLEDKLEKGWQRWTPALDLKRDKLNLFYDCLYFLAKNRFRSKILIRRLQRSSYFRNNPDKLVKIIRVFSLDFLSLNWNSKLDKAKLLLSQGILALLHGEFRFLFLKIKQQIKDPDAINV